MALRSQDVLLVLKLVVKEGPEKRLGEWTYAGIASSIGISLGEIHNGLVRLRSSGLINETGGERRVMRKRLYDFLVYGVPVAFFGERGEVARGVPTSIFAAPLAEKAFFAPEDIALVWPLEGQGRRRGESLKPIYPSAVEAALEDAQLYELLVLLDVLRVGRTKEKRFASDLLAKKLCLKQEAHHADESQTEQQP